MKRTFSLVFLLVGALMVLTYITLAAPMHTPAATSIGTVDVWLTTGDETHKLQHQTVDFIPGSGSNPRQIQVNESITYQQMDGFGAALTDSSAWLISNMLNATQAYSLMNELFSPSEGIGTSYVRLPMGASDFVTSAHYTYDDMPPGMTDTNLISFSIAHDQAYIIPLLQQARSINPRLRVMVSPWSPPAWMKSPETLYGGSLEPEYYQVYANYFVKFVQSYGAEGIPIHAVTIQNEPHYTNTTYPTMWMEWWQQADFVENCLGPAFDSITTTVVPKILTWDHNWDEPSYPIRVLNDADARTYIAGSAWHCYACNPCAQTSVHEAHPDKDIYLTECTGGEWDNDFASVLVWNLQNLFIGSVRNWAKTVLLWNLALDENHGPHLGGCDNCRGVVTIDQTGMITYNVEYYAIGHLGKFVDPGAYRIESDYFPELLESVAFQNPDGSIVLVVLNPGTVPQSFDVQWNGQHFPYNLPPQSVATFKWNVQRVYLPLVLRAYRPPVSFQNFEPDNGTPGDYFADIWFGTCVFEYTIAHEGSRSVRCHAHDEADGDPGDHGGTVGIYPSSSEPVDLSSGTTISVWVYDTQDNNTVELRLCDDNGYSNAVWSEEQSFQHKWTRITWPLSAFAGVDKSQIRHIRIYEWNDGIYYFDAVTWQ